MISSSLLFRKANNRLRWLLFLFGLLQIGIMALISMPLFDAPYPDLGSFLPFFSFMAAPLLFLLTFPLFQSISIQLFPDHLTVRKGYGKKIRIAYRDIVGYAERQAANRWKKTNQEIAIYSHNEWFMLQEAGFKEYSEIKKVLVSYGTQVPFRQTFSKIETTLVRCFILCFSALMLVTGWYGFVAYTPPTSNGPVVLHTLEGVIEKITINRHKGNFKGITIWLQGLNEIHFYARKSHFSSELQLVPQRIPPSGIIRLTILESDYTKKIVHTTPLSFGDKFDRYNHLTLYGIETLATIPPLSLKATTEIKENTHTSPTLWLFGSIAGLLVAWTAWVFVNRQQLSQILLSN